MVRICLERKGYWIAKCLSAHMTTMIKIEAVWLSALINWYILHKNSPRTQL